MALTKLDTEHFSDVEVAAREIANNVRDLQTIVSTSRTATVMNWMGDARNEFEDLSYVIEQQMKDISDEFWTVYESLVEAEGTFIEADNALATEFNSVIDG